MKIIKLFLRIIWNIKSILITSIILVSLALNMVLLVGGPLFSIINSGFEALTGIPTIAFQNKAEIATLSRDLSSERKANQTVRKQLSELEIQNTKLKKQQLINFKGKKVTAADAVKSTADRISVRSTKTAAREIIAMPGKAIPFYGVAMIVGATTLELNDLCETVKDMAELKAAIDPKFVPRGEELSVCSMPVPPKEEVVAMIKNSPQKAWVSAKDAVPTLDELRGMEVPDIEWSKAWTDVSGQITNLSGSIMGWWDPQ